MLNKKILVLIFLLVFLPLVGCFPTPSNQAPIINSIPVTAVTVGENYVYDVEATDPNGDTLTYSLITQPTGMTINPSTGLIKWTPKTEGKHAVVVKVSDGVLDIIQSFTIVVSKPYTPPLVNHAPIITSIPNLANLTTIVGAKYIYEVKATDPDGDILTYSLTTYPSGMTISSATGVISWKPTATGSYDVTLKVSDGKKSITQSFTIIVEAVELTGIVVLPEAMILFEGDSKGIKSVTAHYNNGSTAKIPVLIFEDGTPACECESRNENVATVTDTGLVTAIKEGTTTITVSYTEGGITRTDNIEVIVNPPPVFIAGTVYSNIEHLRGYAIVWNNTAPEFYPFENQVLVPFKTGPEGEWELHSIRLWGALGTANIRIYEDGHPIEIVEVTYGNVIKSTWIGAGIEPLYEWQVDNTEWVEQEKVEPPPYTRTNKVYTLPAPVILDANTIYWFGVEPPSTPVGAGFTCYITESTYNPAGYDLTSLVMELFGGYWQY